MRPSIRRPAFFLFLALALAAHTAPTHSQDRPSESPTLFLSFGQASGRIGEEVPFPIHVSSSTAIREAFTIVLQFSPAKLSYVRMGEAATPARTAGWQVEANLKTAPPAFDMHFLEIAVEPGEEAFFPEGGLLALAYFKVLLPSEDHAIELSPSVKFHGQTPIDAQIEAAEIVTRPEAMLACFFYMH